MREERTFYTVSDQRFFTGLIGMINSLRLLGHEERIVVLDLGLTSEQRCVISGECEIFTIVEAEEINPQLLKPFANLLHPRGTVIVIDSDLAVTHRLDQIFERAEKGEICACADPESGRWFAEWEALFGLSRTPRRRQTYVSSGLVAFSARRWPDLLPYWWQACQRIRSHQTVFHQHRDSSEDGPVLQGDQDALNAILMSEIPHDALSVQPESTQPNHDQLRQEVRLLDTELLSCSLGGDPVTLVHPGVKRKSWERQWWVEEESNPYPALLRRLLVGPDVRLRPVGALPLWLRPGRSGDLLLELLSLANRGLGPLLAAAYGSRLLRKGWRLLRRIRSSPLFQLRDSGEMPPKDRS